EVFGVVEALARDRGRGGARRIAALTSRQRALATNPSECPELTSDHGSIPARAASVAAPSQMTTVGGCRRRSSRGQAAPREADPTRGWGLSLPGAQRSDSALVA